ncbi:hypothetical protein VTN77DRAFT_3556 [Rasamsonia byssochlamydoides]|uniref:uncharacterized protein n=1 Tax=Rasamsonia byssochlamydoides TaxID=89139 RepID=UPI00374371FA
MSDKDKAAVKEIKQQAEICNLPSSKLPTELALRDLKVDDFGPLFGLKPDRQYEWSLSPCERCGKPEGLDKIIDEFRYALENHAHPTALIRARLGVILTLCLADEKREIERQRTAAAAAAGSRQSDDTSLQRLRLHSEPVFTWKTEYQGIPRLLTDRADYALWYGRKEELEMNLVVVEAAKEKLGESYLRCKHIWVSFTGLESCVAGRTKLSLGFPQTRSSLDSFESATM